MTNQITIPRETFDAMRGIVLGVAGMVSNCDVSSGVCCCGDSMTNHPDPMYCGHSPVDSGVYAADSLLKKAEQALTAANAVQPQTPDEAMEAHALALADNLAQSESDYAVYATEHAGKPYAVTVETAERFNAVQQAQWEALPLEGSEAADNAIHAMLCERQWPSSSMNAARAGWRAARLFAHPQATKTTAKKLIGWRTADYLRETDDPEMAKNWDVHYEILPIFEGDANTKLTAAPKAQTTESVRVEALNKLGKRLAELLDEDQWAECEKLLISLRGEKPVAANAVSYPQATEPAWRPIESAPKSEEVLLWATKQKPHAFIGFWDEYDTYNQPRITHWMPLPAAPEAP